MKATLLIAALSTVWLQAQPVSSPAAPKFEVVSIRRHNAESGPVQTGPIPEGFRSIGLPVFARISVGVCASEPARATTVDQADLADWQKPATRQTMLRAMLQAMLAERCKVVVHFGGKEAPVYDLVIAKGGPKFQQAETVDTAELRRKHPEGGMMRGSVTMAA